MPVVGFSRPLALLLLPLVVLIVALGRRRTGVRWRVATALRAATVGLLLIALTGPTLRVPASGTDVVFAVDRSRSITEAGQEAESAFLADALARMHPDDRAGIVTFAGRPLLRAPLGRQLASIDPGPAPDPDATDIGAAIDLAARVLPRDGARRIVLLSDGAENHGDAAAAARAAAAAGISVDAVPILTGTPADVLVDDVVAPQEVRVGTSYEVRAVLRATAPAEATVTLRRDGLPIAFRRLALEPGETAVRFSDTARQAGTLHYAVDITASPDAIPDNDHGDALVIVRGRPRVLFVSESPSRLPGWLRGQGLQIDVRPPAALPALSADLASYASVVLDDVAASDLSRAQQDALRVFVGTMGGGLVAIGGPHAFGVGGYAGTPLEDVLPVRMDVRQTTEVPTVAVVLVIDTSGSMEAFGTELAKEALAREIATSVIDLLGEHDQIGIITFDQEYRWLVPPTEARNRTRVLRQVARLTAGGGTVMYPPLVAARNFLRTSPAKIRHIIVLSDGLTDPGNFHALVTSMARDRITLSTVAIGDDADVTFMRNMARWGGGRSYIAKDLYSIPEIFTTEALVAVRSYIVEKTVRPIRAGAAPTLEGLAPPPPLRGYVATVAKPTADVALAAEGRREPILATWRYGLGRTVAFTSDDGTRWTSGWTPWRDVARFWSQAIRWTLGNAGHGLYLDAAREDRGAGARVVLEARHPDGTPWDGLAVTGVVEEPGGARRPIAPEQTAPGRYEAAWPAQRPGVYSVTVAARGPEGIVGTSTAGLVVPYSPELRLPGGNLVLLSRVTEITGGALLHVPEEAFRQGHGTGTRDVWPPLAGSAILALVAEIAVRRVPALAQRVALAGAVAASWVRAASRPPEASGREDRAYEAADRWAVENERYAEEDALRASSMDQAARLYVARLRADRSKPRDS
jgi:Ca-activated chloride channel family protein